MGVAGFFELFYGWRGKGEKKVARAVEKLSRRSTGAGQRVADGGGDFGGRDGFFPFAFAEVRGREDPGLEAVRRVGGVNAGMVAG
jgi:hypothetical protein